MRLFRKINVFTERTLEEELKRQQEAHDEA